MRHFIRALSLLVLGLAGLASACGGSDGEASLSLQWSPESGITGALSPSESLKSRVLVSNEGGADLERVVLRFDQNGAGQLPFGVSVGTVTHLSSRFEGDAQVWDLGSLGAGDTLVFPITLWFEAASRTAEPMTVRLLMIASSPDLDVEVASNLFEVQVDAREATSR